MGSDWDSNPQPYDSKARTLTTAPSCYPRAAVSSKSKLVLLESAVYDDVFTGGDKMTYKEKGDHLSSIYSGYTYPSYVSIIPHSLRHLCHIL